MAGDNEQIVAHLLTKGVTKCPTVFLNKSKQSEGRKTLTRKERCNLREHHKVQTLIQELKFKELFYNRQMFGFAIGFWLLPLCKWLT
jgi:23S rRNA C2498 (ribose-2'-O)-methylase RlmM